MIRSDKWTQYAASRSAARNRWLYLHHRLVTDAFVDYADTLPTDLRVLDAGCGNGFFMQLLRDLGFPNVRGLDLSEPWLEECRSKNLDVQLGAIEDIGPDQEYDLILLMDVVEHLSSPATVLATLRRCLSASGKMYMNIPVCDSLQKRWQRCLRGVSRLDQSRRWDETHRHAWSARDFDQLLRKAGLKPVRRVLLSNPWPVAGRFSGALSAALQRVTCFNRFGDLYSVVAEIDDAVISSQPSASEEATRT
ncbi:MAG: class I SAM-dependent methyltransferase [Armatimonadetes bacterium]|nr:class I SAM-dependent methyltransferase [Armatimonadota bacterium]